jgi:hypothetical protein
MVGNDTLILKYVSGNAQLWAYDKAELTAGTLNPITIMDRDENELLKEVITVS